MNRLHGIKLSVESLKLAYEANEANWDLSLDAPGKSVTGKVFKIDPKYKGNTVYIHGLERNKYMMWRAEIYLKTRAISKMCLNELKEYYRNNSGNIIVEAVESYNSEGIRIENAIHIRVDNSKGDFEANGNNLVYLEYSDRKRFIEWKTKFDKAESLLRNLDVCKGISDDIKGLQNDINENNARLIDESKQLLRKQLSAE